jgi:hypothetical protein
MKSCGSGHCLPYARKKTRLTVPGFCRILFASSKLIRQNQALYKSNGEIRSLYLLKASPQAVFLVFKVCVPLPRMRWHIYLLVSDVTPDPFFDQLSQQAHQGIQALCLTDIYAFTGGGIWFHNAHTFIVEGRLCQNHYWKSRPI